MTPEELWQDLQARAAGMLVVTGGEPLLQQGLALTGLLRLAQSAQQWVEIETAGTVAPKDETAALVDRFNVSPKLANSGNDQRQRLRPDALGALRSTGKAVWKFVVRIRADLDEVEGLVEAHGLTPVWIMPEGTALDQLTQRSRELADAVLERGWNLTTRLHVQIWGDRRGV